MKKKWLIAAICVLMLLCSACTAGESNESTQTVPQTEAADAWKNNNLRSSEIPMDEDGNYEREEASSCSVFGSGYLRDQIKSVTFLDSLENVPEDAWDVSAEGSGNVWAWVEPNGELYDLYIGAQGGVCASGSCRFLFAGYCNAEKITFGDAFHTDYVYNMQGMFDQCSSLTELELSSFNTSNVVIMKAMFSGCESLTELNLSGFDTSNVQDMQDMFNGCYELTELDLSGFDTSNVQDMSRMFGVCLHLENLDVTNFDTTAVRDMSSMFSGCERLGWVDLSSFDTSNVENKEDMFKNCPAGAVWGVLLP